jgi:hypothetical protein
MNCTNCTLRGTLGDYLFPKKQKKQKIDLKISHIIILGKMSDLSGNNHRLECPICKKDFLNKSFSNHLLNFHKDYIFTNKDNKETLKEYINKKIIYSGDYMAIKIDDTIQYFVPCCNKFYTKEGTAVNHLKKKECKDKALGNAKELLSGLTPISVDLSTTIDNSGNNNTNTVNNNQVINITNYNLYDLSNNLLKTITKEATKIIDDERYDKVSYLKKLRKLKTIFENHPDYNSDISSIASAYDSDDESDTTLSRMDFKKDFEKYNKKIATQLSEAKIDVSRKSLSLKTKEDSIKMKEENKQQQEQIEEFEQEQEQEERSEKIGNLRENIASIKDQIKRLTKTHNQFLELMKHENSGITQEIFDSEYSQTKKINSLNDSLIELQKQLNKLSQ